jgi:hypothetical protein
MGFPAAREQKQRQMKYKVWHLELKRWTKEWERRES